MINPAPLPWTASVVQLDPQTGRPLPGWMMSKDFGNWFVTSVVSPIATTPQFFPAVDLTGQTTSIGVTPIPLPSLSQGAYRVSYYARITSVDPVSSSLIVTIGWTDSGVTLTSSGSAITGNLTTSVQSGTLVILSDAASPITYSTTDVSSIPGTMAYRLYLLVESL